MTQGTSQRHGEINYSDLEKNGTTVELYRELHPADPKGLLTNTMIFVNPPISSEEMEKLKRQEMPKSIPSRVGKLLKWETRTRGDTTTFTRSGDVNIDDIETGKELAMQLMDLRDEKAARVISQLKGRLDEILIMFAK